MLGDVVRPIHDIEKNIYVFHKEYVDKNIHDINIKQEKTITNPKNIKFKNLYKEHWSRVKILLNTVEDLELIGPNFSKEVTLFRLFHEENTKIYESQNILFG